MASQIPIAHSRIFAALQLVEKSPTEITKWVGKLLLYFPFLSYGRCKFHFNYFHEEVVMTGKITVL